MGKQEEKRLKEELKLTLDKLQRKAMAEQNRAAHRKQKQVSLEVQLPLGYSFRSVVSWGLIT